MVIRIGRELENMGYRRVMVNIEKCHLYYREEPATIYTIVLFDCPAGNEFTRLQYSHIIAQIRNSFGGSSGRKVVLQSIICTNRVQEARGIFSSVEHGWIVDQMQERLLVYEWHDTYFDPVRSMIEQVSSGIRSYVSDEGRGIEYQPWNPQQKKKQKLFGFSPVNVTLIIINILIYLAVAVTGSVYDTAHMMKWGAIYWPSVFQEGEYWRVFTYMFLHYGFDHLFNNMLVLSFLGDNLERAIGKVRFLILYMGSGLIAGFASMGWNMMLEQEAVGVGASGAIFGAVGALVYIVAVNKGKLEDLSIRRLLFFVFLSLYGGLTSQGVDNVAHIAGFIAGFCLAVILYRRKPDRDERKSQANPGYQL